MSKEYSKEIAEAIRHFLVEDDWHFTFEEDRGIFRFDMGLNGKLKTLRYIMDVQEDSYLVYGISPVGADSEDLEQMLEMAEFITRANYGLKDGGFEMDWRDGEIRYRIYVDCDGQLPGEKVIRNSLYYLAFTFDRYASGLVDVVFSGVDAKTAVKWCEQQADERMHRLLDNMAGKKEGEDQEEPEDGEQDEVTIWSGIPGLEEED